MAGHGLSAFAETAVNTEKKIGPVNKDTEGTVEFERAADRARALANGESVGNVTDNSKPVTVAEAIVAFKSNLKTRGGNPENARRLYRRDDEGKHVGGIVPAALQAMPVAMLTAKDLKRFRDGLAARMKKASVNRQCKPLKAALTLAADNDPRIGNREAWRMGLAAFKGTHADRRRHVSLTTDEVRALIGAAYEVDAALGLLVETLAGTGARISQIARLTTGDVLPGDRLHMPSSKKGKGEKVISRKPVPITASLAAKLRLAAATISHHQPLLRRSDGAPWAKENHRTAFMAAVAKAGLSGNVTSYALRHSAITQMLVRGVPIRIVADLHDTSVGEIEKTYSEHITSHGEDMARAARLDSGEKVVTLRSVS